MFKIMKKLKELLNKDLNEIIFSLYFFLPTFLLPVSILLGTKTYKFIFYIFIGILLIASVIKNRKLLSKRNIVHILSVILLFSLDFFLRKNIYTINTYLVIIKSVLISFYFFSRINNYKNILKYLSIFSKIIMVIYFFDPVYNYPLTITYMGYGYGVMLPCFLSIYIYHLIEKKYTDWLFILLGFVGNLVFSNRACILSIMFAFFLTLAFSKKSFQMRDNWNFFRKNFKKILLKNIIVLILFAIFFGVNFIVSNHYNSMKKIDNDKSMITNDNSNENNKLNTSSTEHVEENNNVGSIIENKKNNFEVEETTSESENNKHTYVVNKEVSQNGKVKLNFYSYAIEKYKQVLNGKTDRIFSNRFKIYKDALSVIKRDVFNGILSLLFGKGTGYFRSLFDGVYTHFIFFDLLIEYGLFGLFAFTILLVYCLVMYKKAYKEDKMMYLVATFCLAIAFPKLLLSSYFQSEASLFLFLLIITNKYPIKNIFTKKTVDIHNIKNGGYKMKKNCICKRCVMDNVNTDIEFDSNGICNYCTEAEKNLDKIWKKNGEKELQAIINKMKLENKDKKYDCILGLSGGVDSCYTAYLLKKYDVRMLAVHIDGGWNTDISNRNVKLLCEKLNIDLHTININKKEMYDLQRAYFLAEVKNQDVPQDHIFFSELYRYALKNHIKYFISGGNYSSECILPKSWGFNAMDGKNLTDIHRKYGSIKLKDIKPLSFFEIYVKIPYIDRLKKIRPLNYIDYDKEKAIKELHDEIGFEYYGGKHCESVFTRLYQNYILLNKFGINKTKAHYSSLIVSGQMSRKEAMEKLKSNEYTNNKELLESDIAVFLNNTGLTRKEFDEKIENKFVRSHEEFKNFKSRVEFFRKIKHFFIKK